MISRRSLVAGAMAGLVPGAAEASKLLVPPSSVAVSPPAGAPAAKVPAGKALAPKPAVAADGPLFQPAPAVEPFAVDMNQWQKLQSSYQRQDVKYDSKAAPGSIVVDATRRYLYLITGPGTARRYGCSVGKQSKAWSGDAVIARMAVWPIWMPAPYHLSVSPALSKWIPGGMPGGPDNPLGARAMYLYQNNADTLNRIHGGAKLEWIGDNKTAGCISLLDCDVIDLYARVRPHALVSVTRKFWPFG